MVKKGSKKSKGKKKRESEELKEEISEVDKEYYQILINDLQLQIAKLTERCQELEIQNEAVQSDYKRLDEDRADVIAFLRRQLAERSSEASELQERLTGLRQARADEAQEYETRIATMDREANISQEQLSAELKLLQGKLNSLEEFRSQRDDLNAKFECQEQQIRDHEARHQQALHDVERKFIISKDRLKQEMEQQLLRLSTEYQAATTTRIAATTQRAVRENVALQAEVARLRQDTLRMRSRLGEQESRCVELQRELSLARRLLRIAPHVKSLKDRPSTAQVQVQTDVEVVHQRYMSIYDHEATSEQSQVEEGEAAISNPDDNDDDHQEQTSGSGDSETKGPSYLPGDLGFLASSQP